MELSQAIAMLDPSNDDHWTADDLPAMALLVELTDDKLLTRRQVTEAHPTLTRTTAPELVVPETTPTPEESEEKVSDPILEESEEKVSDPILEDGSLLNLSPQEVFVSIEQTERFIQEVAEHCAELERKSKLLKEELKLWYSKSELATRTLQRMQRSKPNSDTATVRTFLAQQREAREQRAARARRFIEAGTTAKDVADQLRPGSKLDAAMQQRKPAPGSTRPALGLPVRK